jgi:hypothetical protein
LTIWDTDRIPVGRRDITDRKLVEDALHQVNNTLNRLSTITRQDILNNITACKGFLTIIKEILPVQETLFIIDIHN